MASQIEPMGSLTIMAALNHSFEMAAACLVDFDLASKADLIWAHVETSEGQRLVVRRVSNI